MKYGYTIVIYDQKKEKNIVVSRDLTETITPGMYISHYDNNVKETNNLSCVIIKPYNDITSEFLKFTKSNLDSGYMGDFGPLDIEVLQYMYGSKKKIIRKILYMI